jgi:hypothetical protein
MLFALEYEDPSWTYVYVPAYSYDEEPIGFFINPRDTVYSGVGRSYDDLYGIRRRRYALEDRLRLDDVGYAPLPRRHASPTRRRSRSSVRDYAPVTVPQSFASVPVFRKPPTATRYSRQLRFDRNASVESFPFLKEDHYTANVDLKADSLNRSLLKRDLDTTLHSLYANKGTSVRSKRDFDLYELQRLDRKQNQMSKYLSDFKRDFIKAKYPNQDRYLY